MEGRREAVLAWFATGFTCLYFAWSYYRLLKATESFAKLFVDLGVELPASTRFVIGSHSFLYLFLFVGAGALVIAKEMFVHNKRYSLLITLVVAVLVSSANILIGNILKLPFQDLVRKLSGPSSFR
jgi:hypothetical protein